MTAVTLTAGDVSGFYQGYARSGSALGFPLGSISGQPLAGQTIDVLSTGSGWSPDAGYLFLVGDTTGLGALTLTVDGAGWTVGTGSYDGGSNTTFYTVSGGTFANGVAYSVDLSAGGGGPTYAGPAWVGKSTALGSTGSGTIDFTSSGRASGDRLYIAIASANESIATPTGFTQEATVSPQSRGTAAAAGGIRGALFWKDSDGTETTVSIADPGNHVYAQGFVVRPASGQTIATHVSAGKDAAASTSHSGNGLTTTDDDCLIIDVWYTDRDSAGPSYSGEANATPLGSLTERHDAGTTSGVGSGIVIYSGEKQAAGSVTATTATSAASVAWCAITLALKNATGAPTLTVANTSHAHVATQPSLATANALTVANAVHAHAATSPTISSKATLAPADAAHGSISTSPGITANAALVPADTLHDHAATSPAITLPGAAIYPVDAVHGHTSSGPTISGAASLTAADSVHGHIAASPTISTNAAVAIDGPFHTHAATSPAIAFAASLTPEDANHGHTVTQPTIAVRFTLIPANASHGHVATQPSMTVSGALAIDSAMHGHAATSPSLTTLYALAPDSAAHLHAATSPTLASAVLVTAANASHAHQATSPAIATLSIIAPASTLHLHYAGEPTIRVSIPPTKRIAASAEMDRIVASGVNPRLAASYPGARLGVTAVTGRTAASVRQAR